MATYLTETLGLAPQAPTTSGGMEGQQAAQLEPLAMSLIRGMIPTTQPTSRALGAPWPGSASGPAADL